MAPMRASPRWSSSSSQRARASGDSDATRSMKAAAAAAFAPTPATSRPREAFTNARRKLTPAEWRPMTLLSGI